MCTADERPERGGRVPYAPRDPTGAGALGQDAGDERRDRRAILRAARVRPQIPGWVRQAGQALGLPFSEVARYWVDERQSMRRGLAALGVGLFATLIAGLALSSATGRLEALPGLLLVVPAAIGMRGNNFGALAARLGTGIHTGEFGRELARDTFFGRQIEAAALLTLTSTAEIAVLGWLIGRTFGIEVISLWDLTVISVVGGLLSSVVLLGVTIALARAAHERGWNMDDVGAPAITATGDLVTIPALLLASLLVGIPVLTPSLAVVALVGGAWALWAGLRHERPDIRRIVRESAVVLTAAAAVDIFAGTVIETRVEQFLDLPALLVLIPPFIAACGSLGGILASRFASKLHLGLIEARSLPGKMAALDVSVTFVFSFAAFTGVALVTRLAAGIADLDTPPVGQLLAISLGGGALAFLLLSTVAYIAATATYRFGLDPDNHSIPIVTATMDLLGVLCVVAAIAVVRMG